MTEHNVYGTEKRCGVGHLSAGQGGEVDGKTVFVGRLMMISHFLMKELENMEIAMLDYSQKVHCPMIFEFHAWS